MLFKAAFRNVTGYHFDGIEYISGHVDTESFVEVKEGSLVLLIFFDHFMPFSIFNSAL